MPRYIDLTLNLQPGMRGVETDVAREQKKDGWNATTFHLYSHSGTHMDAPTHFGVNSITLDEIPVERFFVTCWIIDLTDTADSALIEIKDLGDISNKIREGEGLIFHTGWSKYVGTNKFRDSLPRISSKLAKWCVKQKISLIGVEPPSIADVNNMAELTEVHTILLQEGIQIIEGLTNLNEIKKEKVQIVALPIKIKDSDGAPARVIAIEE